MGKLLLALFVLTLLGGLPSAAQDAGTFTCKKTFIVTGRGIDGIEQRKLIIINRGLREPSGFDVEAQYEADKERYPFNKGYQVVPNSATETMNCSGYVYNKLFNTGPTKINVTDLRTQILNVFAESTTLKPFYLPQPNDVVIFGNDSHVAVVVEPSSNRSSAVIEGKDNQESIVKGTVDLSISADVANKLYLSKDPIRNKHGNPTIYHFKHGIPKFTPVAASDCDPDLNGQWVDKGGSVYTFQQTTDMDGMRVTGMLQGSARSGHPLLTGKLDAKLGEDGETWTGRFKNLEADSKGNLVWSDGEVTFKVKDGRLDGEGAAMLHWGPKEAQEKKSFWVDLHFQRVSPSY